jgi:hypothetical protein
MCEPWADPIWDSVTYRNHLKATAREWERSIARARTGVPGEKSQYDPNLTTAQIERMEMDCVSGHAGTFIRESGHLRMYWRKMPDTIGASSNQFTDYLYVQWHCGGSVHGYPLTKKELNSRKRANIP